MCCLVKNETKQNSEEQTEKKEEETEGQSPFRATASLQIYKTLIFTIDNGIVE